jgi:putative transposase
LKLIYPPATEAEAEQQLVTVAEKWDKQDPIISRSWLNPWARVIPFFAFPLEIRKALYTTNAIESLNLTLTKGSKHHRAFPTDESALKVVYLAMPNLAKKWTMPIPDWKPALNRFAMELGDRLNC